MTVGAAQLLQAAERRAHLLAEGNTFYRLLHTTESGGELSLDRVGGAGVLSLYRELSPQAERALLEDWAPALRRLELSGLYIKRRPPVASHSANVEREHLSPPLPVWGEHTPEVTALENGAAFLMRPGADLSVGLFADARTMRGWVRQNSGDRRVLNLFSYTCGFGVAALQGGAETVKNVDLSSKVLRWGQENTLLNGFAAPNTDFLQGEAFEWLRRLQRRGDRFDLIVLDPPSFARFGGKRWQAATGYAALVAAAVGVLDEGGLLLSMTNHSKLSLFQHAEHVRSGAAEVGVELTRLEQVAVGDDFPAATHLKAVAWRRR